MAIAASTHQLAAVVMEFGLRILLATGLALCDFGGARHGCPSARRLLLRGGASHADKAHARHANHSKKKLLHSSSPVRGSEDFTGRQEPGAVRLRKASSELGPIFFRRLWTLRYTSRPEVASTRRSVPFGISKKPPGESG